jgi:drug/metabolite transporter (DMT)-like permease
VTQARQPKAASKHEEDWDIEHVHAETQGSRTMLLVLILISVGLAAAAQITLKHGMNQVVDRTGAAFRFSGPSLKAVALTPAVWGGLALFGLSAFVWLAVLSRAALSFAYPFAALTYAIIVLYDLSVGEHISGLRWAGVALIVAGIILVSRTPAHG